jgi:hypothetical protein
VPFCRSGFSAELLIQPESSRLKPLLQEISTRPAMGFRAGVIGM